MTDWANEREVVLRTFNDMLAAVTGDGSKKRQAGTKPPWWRDNSHEAAIFSHLNAWKHGVLKDKDSQAHPLTHCAWRCLAIAWQETHGQVDPANHSFTPCPLDENTPGHNFTCALLCTSCGLPAEKHRR